MQNRKSSMILDLLNEEIQGIFSLIDKIPYNVMLKIIGLNSVLKDQANDKEILKEIAKKMDISEDSLKALDILDRINKLDKMIFNACQAAMIEEQKRAATVLGSIDNPLQTEEKIKVPESLAAEELFPILAELMKRNQGENINNLLKMQDFCNRLGFDISKTNYSEAKMHLATFQSAARYVLNANDVRYMEEYKEKEDEEDDFQLTEINREKEKPEEKKPSKEQKAQEEQKKLNESIAIMAQMPATQGEIVPEIKIEQKKIVKLAGQFIESDKNELLSCYRGVHAALQDNNIEEAIKLLAKLGELSAKRDVGQQLLIGMPINVNAMPPIKLLVAIKKLNKEYNIFSDPLLVDGYEAFKTLIGSHRFEKAAQAVTQIERFERSYFEPVMEALLKWDKSRPMEKTSYTDPMLMNLEMAIQALKEEADNFECPSERLHVVNLANKLHKSLDWYAHSTEKDKAAMEEMRDDFREIMNSTKSFTQPLTFREKISHILLTIERMIKQKVTDKKESHYKFYSAKKQLSDKLKVTEKLIKKIEPANDSKYLTIKTSKK